MGETFEGVIDRWATGGAAITAAPSGRLVLAEDAVVGDRAVIEITVRHKRHAEGRVVEVLTAGEGRRSAPCPHARLDASSETGQPRCGGCDWQHLTPAAASAARRAIVADSFRRLGRFADDELELSAGPELASVGYRTIVRAGVEGGRAGFRQSRSHHLTFPDACTIAHPLAAELLLEGRFGAATSVSIKVGARTGERMVVLEGPVGAGHTGVSVPDDVVVVSRAELDAGRRAFVHEEIAGVRLRISADSFFQCRPDGAEALVAAATEGLAGAPDGPFVDLYAGVGLFAGAMELGGRAVTAVEANPSSTADAVVNLPAATVVTSTVERWRAGDAAVVVADPSRRGLGRPGVSKVLDTGASRLVLVSCDPAAAARDARLLSDEGFRLGRVTVVDLFGETSHIEVVSVFSR